MRKNNHHATRAMAVLLAFVLCLAMLPAAALAADSEAVFTDVAESDWSYSYIMYAYEKGLMKGTSDTTFSPATPTSRSMIVTILYRLEGEPSVTGLNEFPDVPDGDWYTDAVIWASEHGIVLGYDNGLFGPEDDITREQMAAILYRYAAYQGYDVSAGADLSGYADADAVDAWALTEMQWAIAAGLLVGTSDTTLSPLNNATRAEIATILQRFCELFPDVPDEPEVEIVDSGTCGDDLTWTLDSEGVLTISGEGAMTDYSQDEHAPWYLGSSTFGGTEITVRSLVIEDGVTHIGAYAFNWCRNLTSVTIPGSVETIGDRAFYDCTGLSSVTISDGVTSIGEGAFYYCTSLTSITIPGSVETIGANAFYYCTSLKTVAISDGVTSIEDSAFYWCTKLTSVLIPASVTEIGTSAFGGCSRLANVYYAGSQEDWAQISIGSGNTRLTNAAIQCGYTVG